MSKTETKTIWDARIDYELLDEFLAAPETILDEFRLHIDEDGMSLSAADPANVAIVTADLSADAFDEYETNGPDIGLNVRSIRDVLETMDPEGAVSLSLHPTSKKLTLSAGDYSYTYAYISPDAIRSDATMPEMDLSATVEIEGDRLDTAANFCAEASNKANVGYDPDAAEFYLTAQGDTDDGEFRVPRHDLAGVHQSGDADSLYSLDYLTDITGAIPSDRTVTLEVGQEFPYSMSYGIAPGDGLGTGYHGEVQFLQAPRIVSGDD